MRVGRRWSRPSLGVRSQQVTEPPSASPLASTGCPAPRPPGSSSQVLPRVPSGTRDSAARVRGAALGSRALRQPCLGLPAPPGPTPSLFGCRDGGAQGPNPPSGNGDIRPLLTHPILSLNYSFNRPSRTIRLARPLEAHGHTPMSLPSGSPQLGGDRAEADAVGMIRRRPAGPRGLQEKPQTTWGADSRGIPGRGRGGGDRREGFKIVFVFS